MVRAIRQKNSFKALVFNDMTDEIEIYSQDLSQRENAIQLNLGGDKLINII